MSIIPEKTSRLRACMLCGLLKEKSHFIQHGCENCEQLLQLYKSEQRVLECTSTHYDGVIAMFQPDSSWVAKWQRIDKFVQGVYAIRVSGRLPEEVIEALSDQNIQYRPRDGSVVD